MTTLMKAIRYHDCGGPEVLKLEQVPRPVPKDDEILVQVFAMGVNPVDWKLRDGVARMMQIPLPLIPGGDISGVVEQVGAAVSSFKIGQPVYAMIGLLGAYTDYVAIKASFAAAKPVSMDDIHAASIPLAALTAWQGLFEHGGLKAGQRVLIHGASGGVGGFAVQLSRNARADIVASSSMANRDYVLALGAARIVDGRNIPFDSLAASFDVVLDLVAGEGSERLLGLLKPGGILTSASPAAGGALAAAAAAKGVRVKGIQVHPDGVQLAQIAAQADAGKLQSRIAAVFPLAEAGKAQELSKAGHTLGKIVLRNLALRNAA